MGDNLLWAIIVHKIPIAIILTIFLVNSNFSKKTIGIFFVDETIKKRLYEHWDEGEIVEMLGVISLFGYLNRWNDSMGTSIEDGAVESGNQYLGKHGWEKGKHQ